MKKAIKYLVIINLLVTIYSFGQIIKVDDYGAVGDGVTDDQPAIQNALDALKLNGGELQFTSGKTYIIELGLTLSHCTADKNYLVTTTGDEKATIKIADSTSITYGHWGIFLQSSKNITIDNLHLDGNRDTRDPKVEKSGTYLIQIYDDCNGLRLNDLILENSVIDNVYITTTNATDSTKYLSDFEMHNCILRNGWRSNMSVIRGKNFKIIGCEFTNANGLGDPEAGIDFEPNGESSEYGYKDILVEGCTFKNNRRFGITLTNHEDIEVEGRVTIRNNYFENNGIYLQSDDNVISNNIFRKVDHKPQVNITGLKKDGIIVFSPWQRDDITGTKIYNNYFYDNPLPEGQHLIGLSSTTGPNNEIYSNYQYNNNIEGFISNESPNEQIIHDNVQLNRKEMGYWSMDDATISNNSINDLSDFEQTGTLHNNPAIVSGKYNEALDFSPDNKYVEVPVEDNLDIAVNMTISAWVNWKGSNGESQQIVVGRGNDWRFGLDNSGRLGFYGANNGGDTYTGAWTKSNESIAQNEWTYVTVTYNGLETKIYINGEESSSQTCYGTLGVSSSKIYIGSFSGETYSFNGVIDDVKLYNYALTSEEIATMGNVEDVIVPAVVGQWDFNDPNDLTKATIGDPLELFGNSYSFVQGHGNGNWAILLGNGDYLKAVTNITPSGAGEKVNTYTLSMDIKLDNIYDYASLLQTDISNSSDGDLFINGDKKIGCSYIGYSTEEITEEDWYRLILVLKENSATDVSVDIYLNGASFYSGIKQNVDSRLSLAESVLFFRDDIDEELPTAVSQIALYNYAFTSEEAAAMGTAYEDFTESSIVGQWNFDDTSYLTKATIGEDLVLTGTATVVDGPTSEDGAISLGVGDYLKAQVDIDPTKSAGTKVNTYSILMDIKMDEFVVWNSLMQTDITNSSDGKWFWHNDEMGVKGGVDYTTGLQEQTWYRVVLVVDSINIKIYIDGDEFYVDNSQSINGNLALDTHVFFFLDNGNEEAPTDVAKVVLYNCALTSEQVSDLGDATTTVNKSLAQDEKENNALPTEYVLRQNYPNPFNPSTVIRFALPKQSNVKLSVYNILGEKVAELVNGNLSAGNHEVSFDASNLSSGTYVYRISATSASSATGSYVAVKKMMLLK